MYFTYTSRYLVRFHIIKKQVYGGESALNHKGEWDDDGAMMMVIARGVI